MMLATVTILPPLIVSTAVTGASLRMASKRKHHTQECKVFQSVEKVNKQLYTKNNYVVKVIITNIGINRYHSLPEIMS